MEIREGAAEGVEESGSFFSLFWWRWEQWPWRFEGGGPFPSCVSSLVPSSHLFDERAEEGARPSVLSPQWLPQLEDAGVRARAMASEGSAFRAGGPGTIKDVKECESVQAAILNQQLSSSNRSLLSHCSWLGNIWLGKQNNSWKQIAV